MEIALLLLGLAVSVSVSVWTLVSISLERFFAICRPLHSRRWQTVSHAYQVIGLVWMGSLITMMPICFLSRLLPTRVPGKNKCREVWPSLAQEQSFNIYLDVILLVVPLLIMTLMYGFISRTLYSGIRIELPEKTGGTEVPLAEVGASPDSTRCNQVSSNNSKQLLHNANGLHVVAYPSHVVPSRTKSSHQFVVRGNYRKSQLAKKRVIRMLFVVVLEFFICWTPLYVMHTWSLFDPLGMYMLVGPTGLSVVHLLAYISSCCNPITYCFMNQKFRQGFVAIIGCNRKHRWRSTSLVSGTLNSVFSRRGSIRTEVISQVEDESV